MDLLTPAEVADLLRVSDRRTVVRHLTALNVPRLPFGRSFRVRVVDLERALVAATRPSRTASSNDSAGGLSLPPGVRLGSPEARRLLAR